ncbi:MAG: DUF2796 domain-containing protein [Gammaproteobacteria bacterium]|nr:DUF2796 domain-containing protein [Gammaproteobacteria bacterium]
MQKQLTSIFSLFFLCISSVAMADHVSDDKVDDILLTKGHARMIVFVSGSSIEIEFYTPTINMLNFEGMPSNEFQQAEFDEAVAWLAEVDNVLTLADVAKCTAVVAEVNSSIVDSKAKVDNTKHVEFDAYYVLQCQELSELDDITVNLFAKYPAVKEIFTKKQGIGKMKRGKLSSTNSSISL